MVTEKEKLEERLKGRLEKTQQDSDSKGWYHDAMLSWFDVGGKFRRRNLFSRRKIL